MVRWSAEERVVLPLGGYIIVPRVSRGRLTDLEVANLCFNGLAALLQRVLWIFRRRIFGVISLPIYISLISHHELPHHFISFSSFEMEISAMAASILSRSTFIAPI